MMDASRLATLHAAAFQTDRPWSEDEFSTLLASPHVWPIGNAKAALLARIIADEAEILTLATHPDHQRQGLARAALDSFHTMAAQRGAKSAFLEVAADNSAACALYHQAGYQQVGQRRGYYRRADGPKVDALVLRRPLP